MSRRWSRGAAPLFAAPGGRGGAMARSRRILDRAALGGIVLGAAVLAFLVGQIALANGVVRERADINDLRADRAYLQARVGLLELDWNERTDRAAIVAAAEDMGLVTSGAPSTLIVLDDRGAEEHDGVLGRVLKVVGTAEARASEDGRR